MKITVVGTGYVGLVTGACFASAGNEVTCVDTNSKKIEDLQKGIIPIHEPGLDTLVLKGVADKQLSFTTNLSDALSTAQDCVFIAVGTPPGEDGSADLSYVLAVARDIGQHLQHPTVVVDKSTVPVGTADKVKAAISATMATRHTPVAFSVVSNPEFLKEGAAIKDFMEPARVVVGTDSESAVTVMRELYAPFTRNHERFITMAVRDAEMTKYAANAMLATRISFMNELSLLCDNVGVDIEKVRAGIGSDPRIGNSFLYPGVGYGGSCFPKDVKALVKTGEDHGIELGILKAVESRNAAQKHYLTNKVKQVFGENLTGMQFAVWGLAFKAGTDDMREAPALTIIADLVAAGATVRAFDPVAKETAQTALLESGVDTAKVELSATAQEAIHGSDALLVVTDWMNFRAPDFRQLATSLKRSAIFDGRNLYAKIDFSATGLAYYGVGR